jgi:hypothetical protein
MTKWQIGKNGKLTKSRQNGKVTKFQVEKMAS